MGRCPDMIHQFAKHLGQKFHEQGHGVVEVYADAWLSLNSRPPQRLIDATINLADEPISLRPSRWILTFNDLTRYWLQTVQVRMHEDIRSRLQH